MQTVLFLVLFAFNYNLHDFFQKNFIFLFFFYLARLIFLTTLQDLSTYVDYY